jgi:riboflavin synthase alpha subunit
LGSAEVGDRLNLEVDVIAKYVERLLARDVPRVENTAPSGGTR